VGVETYDAFPILGGRLLKVENGNKVFVFTNVSNPWREAIEVSVDEVSRLIVEVSNPWREAIEDFGRVNTDFWKTVSNPWREAIEEEIKHKNPFAKFCFQSLEGGY